MDVAVTIMISVLMMGVGHWFRWEMLFNGNRPPRLMAYVYGVLAICVPVSGYLWMAQLERALYVLWGTVAGGGLSVMGMHLVDWMLEETRRRQEGEERESELMRALHGTND